MNNISKQLLGLLNDHRNNLLCTLFNHIYHESKNPIIIAELESDNCSIIIHSFNKTASTLFRLQKSNLNYKYDLESYFLDKLDFDHLIDKIKMYHHKKQQIGNFEIKTILKLPCNVINFYIINIMILLIDNVQLLILNINETKKKSIYNKILNYAIESIILVNQTGQICYTNHETYQLFGFNPDNLDQIRKYVIFGANYFGINILSDDSFDINDKHNQIRIVNKITNKEVHAIINIRHDKVQNNLTYVIYYILPLFNNLSRLLIINPRKSVIPISQDKLPCINIYKNGQQ